MSDASREEAVSGPPGPYGGPPGAYPGPYYQPLSPWGQ
jgi:hypothetical protein